MCGLEILKIKVKGALGVSTAPRSCGTGSLDHADFLSKKVLGYLAERTRGGGEGLTPLSKVNKFTVTV